MAGYFMGMHRDLRMQKVLQAAISAELLSIPTTTKFTKAVKYIHYDKSWERCYVLLQILYTCLRVLRLEDSNLTGMEKSVLLFQNDKTVHREKKSDLDYQRVFTEVQSLANIWNTSDEESDEEEPTVTTAKD